MNILYFIVGSNAVYHSQCYFSILSFLKTGKHKFFVYTDHPEFYKHLDGIVETISFNDNDIKEWRGKYDFFWRVKIKVIENFIKKNISGPTVYLDTDTFLYSPIGNELTTGEIAYMHKNEGPLSKMKYTAQKMWKQIAGKNFGGLTMNKTMCMWNAGVVALPDQKREECINTALNICDDMLKEGVVRVVIEQFSLSVALDHFYKLLPAENNIAHYWGNKTQWDKIIQNFCVESFLKNRSIEEDLETFNNIDVLNIPVFIPDLNTKRKLIRLIDKLFPEEKYTVKELK